MKPKDVPRTSIPAVLALVLSWLLAACMAVVYFLRPTELAAIFIWPFTLWVLLGITLSVAARKAPPRPRWFLVGLWLALWLAFDSQLEAFFPPLRERPYDETFRIVSLNCAGGDPAAAEEAVATGAQLILLQESPGVRELEAIRAKLGEDWTFVNGPDASVLARGKTRRIPLPRGTSNFIAVEWEDTLVISLRLQPPVFRLDYWSPDCWRAYAENRHARIEELREIVAWLEANRAPRPLVFGGDFNSPPDSRLVGELTSNASDSFAEGGRGWGGTAINTFPMVRIDQIWLGGGIGTIHSRVRATQNSDHRMVIVDAYRRQ